MEIAFVDVMGGRGEGSSRFPIAAGSAGCAEPRAGQAAVGSPAPAGGQAPSDDPRGCPAPTAAPPPSSRSDARGVGPLARIQEHPDRSRWRAPWDDASLRAGTVGEGRSARSAGAAPADPASFGP